MAAESINIIDFSNFIRKNEPFSRPNLLIDSNASRTSLAAEFAIIKNSVC